MIPIPPGTTSFKVDIIVNDSTGTFSLGNVTNSGVTGAYRIENQTTSTAITIVQGTLGTYAGSSLVTEGTQSNIIGLHQFSIPDAAIPASFGQKVFIKLDNGTASGGRAMYPYPLTLIGSDDDTIGRISSIPATAGTQTLVSTVTTLTNNTPTSGTITQGTIALANTVTTLTNNTPTSGTITQGTVGLATVVGQNGTGGSHTAGTVTLVQSGTINQVLSSPSPTSGTITLVQGGSINYTATVGQNGTGGSFTNGTITQGTIGLAGSVTTAGTVYAGTIGLAGSLTGYLAPDNTGINTAANQAGAAAAAITAVGLYLTSLFSGITVIGNWLRAGFRSSTPDATALSEINGTAGTFTSSRDSLQAGGVRGTLVATGYTTVSNAIVQTTANLANAPSGGGGSGLSGPNVVTVTFEDASLVAVPNVPFTVVGQGTGLANTSGVSTFGLPTDSTSGYTLIGQITNNILFPATTFTVIGATSVTVIGAAASIPAPAAPSNITGYIYSKLNGVLTAGLVMHYQQIEAVADTGYGYDERIKDVTSDGSCIWSMTDLEPGARYQFWVSSTRKVSWTIPVGTATPYQIPIILY